MSISMTSSTHAVMLLALMLSPFAPSRAAALTNAQKREIQIVLDKQVAAWNHGDIAGFMEGYWRSPELVYMNNHSVVRGWQSLLDFYRRSFGTLEGHEMGMLELTDEEFTPIADDAVLVWGKFRVTTPDGTNRGGPYTLLMRKLTEGWRTVYDRTSSEAEGAGSLAGRGPAPRPAPG